MEDTHCCSVALVQRCLNKILNDNCISDSYSSLPSAKRPRKGVICQRESLRGFMIGEQRLSSAMKPSKSL